MDSLEQTQKLSGASLLGVPAFDFFVWALDTYGRGELLMNLHDQLPPVLVNPAIGFLCTCGGLGLLYMAHRRHVASQHANRRVLDHQGNEYLATQTFHRWLVPVGIAFLLAFIAAPILAVTLTLAYAGPSVPPPRSIVPPYFAFLTTKQLTPAAAQSGSKSGISIQQQGRNNIAQVGNNNQATITSAVPFRELTESQRQSLAAFIRTLPPSVLVTVGGVYGSADAANYAGEFFPLFEGRHLDNQSLPAIRTGFPTTFTGVFVATRSDDDSANEYRNAFVNALNSIGIPANRADGSKVPPGDLEFLVGFRPEEVARQ